MTQPIPYTRGAVRRIRIMAAEGASDVAIAEALRWDVPRVRSVAKAHGFEVVNGGCVVKESVTAPADNKPHVFTRIKVDPVAATELYSEAKRRRMRPPEFLAAILESVAVSELFDLVLDDGTAGTRKTTS